MTEESAKRLFDEYVNWRMGKMLQTEEENITADKIKDKSIIFLTPVGAGFRNGTNFRGIGKDDFPEVLQSLGGDSYHPKTLQTFFSFINEGGGHWNLVKHSHNSTESKFTETKINCRGDGACGVHAMVNAVLNDETLKQNQQIIDAAKKAVLDLKIKNTSDIEDANGQNIAMGQAIDFVVNIIGQDNDEKKLVVRKLKNLKRTDGSYQYWADAHDIEVFSNALEVFHLNKNKVLNEQAIDLAIKERKEFISKNIKGENNKRYQQEEFEKLLEFTASNEIIFKPIIEYAKTYNSSSLGSEIDDKTKCTEENISSKEREEIEKAIEESLKTLNENDKQKFYSDGEYQNFDRDLQLAIALSLSEISKITLGSNNNSNSNDNLNKANENHNELNNALSESLESFAQKELKRIEKEQKGRNKIREKININKTKDPLEIIKVIADLNQEFYNGFIINQPQEKSQNSTKELNKSPSTSPKPKEAKWAFVVSRYVDDYGQNQVQIARVLKDERKVRFKNFTAEVRMGHVQKKAEEIVENTLNEINKPKTSEGKTDAKKITESDMNLFIKIMQELANEHIKSDKHFGKNVGFQAWSKAETGQKSLIEQKLASQEPKIQGKEVAKIIAKFKIISKEMQKQAKGFFDTKEGAKYNSNQSGARSYRICQLLPENYSTKSNSK